MPCTCLPSSFPCIAPPFILSSSVQKTPFLLSFSHRGWLAERAQQQTSDLLLPSISYPAMLVSSLFPISRKMYSCSLPSYPRFKTLLWNFKGSICLFKLRCLFYFWKQSVWWTVIVWCLKNSPTSAFPWSAGGPVSTGLCQQHDSPESKANLSRKKNWPAPFHL